MTKIKSQELYYKNLYYLKNQRNEFDKQGVTTADRACSVFFLNSLMGKFPVGVICAELGISQGYFRELRQVHRHEWQALLQQAIDEEDRKADVVGSPANI